MTLPGDETTDYRALFSLDPAVAHLNHGSFGACPNEVLAYQAELRARLERNAMQFFLRDLERLLDETRASLAPLLGASPEDIVFVSNATSGVNAVLRSLSFESGDEILTTNHAYAACKNTLDFVADRVGARVVVAQIPLPIRGEDETVSAISAAVTPKTKIALIDHVTSQSAAVFPIQKIVAALAEKGVDTIVDGAHAVGMVPVQLEKTGAAYTTGNCHKWLCAPKGSAYLHVRRDRQSLVRPLTISHGAVAKRADRSRFFLEFDWPGTIDFSPALSIKACIEFFEKHWPGGLEALRERNRALALRARKALLDLLGGEEMVPASMIGSIASVDLGRYIPGFCDPHAALELEPPAPGIEVPVFHFGDRRLLRVSAQMYNRWSDYERLFSALTSAMADAKARS